MFNTLGIEAIICTFSKILLKILKILKLSEFPIDLYRLFHSIITEGKKELDERLCIRDSKPSSWQFFSF